MDRAEFSRGQLNELKKRLAGLEGLLKDEPLCIYATGSYGRLEAWAESDIDVFFLHEGHPETPFSRLNLIKVSAQLIEATEAMDFPPFSGDGRYLDVHYLELMRQVLGSPEDDSLNAFTARMLLLLESRPVLGAPRYDEFLKTVVSFYFRDFHDHVDHFVPTFLNNDILRFWRTLTLNYEHDRFKIENLSLPQQPAAKAKSALKNYKLKVSRLSTCFSMVVHLASEEPPVTPERVLELCAQTPRERFEALAGRGGEVEKCVTQLLETYDSFLSTVQRPDDELLEAFGDPDTRKQRLGEAMQFGKLIYALLTQVTPPERMRTLVV